ncbi:flagellar motor switch protein FliG [Egibacter rhizosphaerae]|uniref:Flagellar motor switch protein FliG n=1 Tax=Egibacter rhizosphaerae TaxID=1670831 RepID=A0A411YIV3_9ACTN|nr:flagellar motor switch protein FliG [Egibacter rhizosphaerae]QBI21235.1 flagellar motor switch protein FliG [Egibacter rhizosphaerae]
MTADVLQRSQSTALARRSDDVSVREFSRSQKAAAVLLSVGPEVSAQVLQHMTEEEVEQVAYEVATLGDLSPAELRPILEEFQSEALAHGHLVSGGEAHAREMLRKFRGERGDEIVDRVLATVQTSPFYFLRQHAPDEILQQLRDEHPQTIALVTSHLPPKFSARILAELDSETQREVALRVALIDRTSPEVIKRVEATLKQRLGDFARRQDSERGGVQELAGMLNQSDRGTEQSILTGLEERDPELAEQVRQLMFVFEDVTTLDDRAVQEVLRQVDMQKVAVAMKGVADEVKDVILRNLSERARATLEEELELLGPVRVKEVEEAQTEIVQKIRQLEEEGQIVIQRGEGEFVE